MLARGHHVDPDVLATLGDRVDVVARQVPVLEHLTAVRANVLITGVQRVVAKGRNLFLEPYTTVAVLDRDDRAGLDQAFHAGTGGRASTKRLDDIAHVPRHQTFGVVEHCCFEIKPLMGKATLVQGKDG